MPKSSNARAKSPVILMIESEQHEGISSRKLLVETAKHNVITAYQPQTGLALLRRFPAGPGDRPHAAAG